MLILVNTLTGKTLQLNVESTNTIYELKSKILEMDGIPYEFQILIFAGEKLEDEKLLIDYNIH